MDQKNLVSDLKTTKTEKDIFNKDSFDVSKSIAIMQEEQKQERVKNKKLRSDLKQLLNELFILPELRSKANRLLDRAVEDAMKEFSTKDLLKTSTSSTKVENEELDMETDSSENENEEESDQIEIEDESSQYNTVDAVTELGEL